MSHLRIGLLGTGQHGPAILQANLPDNEDLPIRVTALCDLNEDRLAKISGEYGIDSTTTDYQELVARDDLDIIAIYTPGPLHGEQIVAAIDAGKHVMVTKSMVYTMEEAERVVETADRTGRVCLVTQTMRGRYDLIDAKRACDAGELGELFLAEAHYVHDLRGVYKQTPWRVQMPQDLLLGGACHPIDLLRWFMGDIEEVHCLGIRGVSEDYPQEDNFAINVRFKSGKIGRIANFTGVIPPPGIPMVSLTVYGKKGTIRDGQQVLDPLGALPRRTFSTEYHAQRGHQGEMVVMLRHMIDCIRNGTEPWVGPRDGAKIVATGLACWESIRSGLPVKVRNDF